MARVIRSDGVEERWPHTVATWQEDGRLELTDDRIPGRVVYAPGGWLRISVNKPEEEK